MNHAESEPVYQQAAVIPWRRRKTDGAIEIAMITSLSGKRWIVPKGLVDPGELPHESAAREAGEEAGLFGTTHPDPVGRYRYRKWGGTCVVDVFLMCVSRAAESWDEQDMRDRTWLPVEEAAARIREDDLARMILNIERHIDARAQQ